MKRREKKRIKRKEKRLGREGGGLITRREVK
jgi:hypothetical protein